MYIYIICTPIRGDPFCNETKNHLFIGKNLFALASECNRYVNRLCIIKARWWQCSLCGSSNMMAKENYLWRDYEGQSRTTSLQQGTWKDDSINKKNARPSLVGICLWNRVGKYKL